MAKRVKDKPIKIEGNFLDVVAALLNTPPPPKKKRKPSARRTKGR